MEDPIEYVHKHGTCIVTQREVPTDVATYSEALRSAMRESLTSSCWARCATRTPSALR